jgi:hypothetical protein
MAANERSNPVEIEKKWQTERVKIPALMKKFFIIFTPVL